MVSLLFRPAGIRTPTAGSTEFLGGHSKPVVGCLRVSGAMMPAISAALST